MRNLHWDAPSSNRTLGYRLTLQDRDWYFLKKSWYRLNWNEWYVYYVEWMNDVILRLRNISQYMTKNKEINYHRIKSLRIIKSQIRFFSSKFVLQFRKRIFISYLNNNRNRPTFTKTNIYYFASPVLIAILTMVQKYLNSIPKWSSRKILYASQNTSFFYFSL